MNLRYTLEREILSQVEKPSRYLGTELNSVHKNPNEVDLRVALVFPDLYDMGLGNLGVLILYAILNQLPWCWCERAYAPAPDMEALLRQRKLPLFAHESKDPLAQMDLIGFTLQSELTYTNILNIIDLAGIPLRSKGRDDAGPLLCAGGPSVFNPEPLAHFLDFFVVGDGEEVIVEIAECLRAMKGKSRRAKLEALARLDGVYVPELYPFEEKPNGQILPKRDAPKVVKRVVRNLNGAMFPATYIVPFTQQVHDRVGIEVLRGCTQGCRFCQAGMVTRPVRERTIDTIESLLERTLDNTGYEEVSLVSLSTCDYSRVRTLVERVATLARPRNVSVSLPSLRLDSFSVELADMITDVRRSGLTFAPEAASPRLRALINKWIPDEELLHMTTEAFRRGWTHIKTYFMIGLPTERDEDVEAIVDLCRRTLARGRSINPKARVHTGVSTFIPKPFTPFQWAEQIPMEESIRRQDILRKGFARCPGMKFGRHNPHSTFIEGLITRGDRRAGDLIEAAWRRGARLESWDEHLHFEAWLAAIEEVSYDVNLALRQRDLDEPLPWDHIDVLIPKQWLQEDWRRAMALEHAADCRHSKCHKCGVIDRDRPLCAEMLRRSIQGTKSERNWTPTDQPERVEPVAVQRLRFRVGREGQARFLSHHELVGAWVRSLRRARAPLCYSQGFHAHPKVNFSTAFPVGEESEGDYMDIFVKDRIDPWELHGNLGGVLPEGLRVFEVEEVPIKSPSLMSLVQGFSYALHTAGERSSIEARIRELLASEEIRMERRTAEKGRRRRKARELGPTVLNVRPMIRTLGVRAGADSHGKNGSLIIALETGVINGRSVRPREVMALLGLDPIETRIVKRATHLRPVLTSALATA